MFYTNEEIQVIGINIENINFNDEIEIKQKFSKLNEDLRLKNRYKKVCEENDELKKKLGNILRGEDNVKDKR